MNHFALIISSSITDTEDIPQIEKSMSKFHSTISQTLLFFCHMEHMHALDSLTASLFVCLGFGIKFVEGSTPGPLTPYVLHIPPHYLSCIMHQVFTRRPPPPPSSDPRQISYFTTLHTVAFPFLLSYTQRILSYQVSGLVTHPVWPSHTDILLV